MKPSEVQLVARVIDNDDKPAAVIARTSGVAALNAEATGQAAMVAFDIRVTREVRPANPENEQPGTLSLGGCSVNLFTIGRYRW